MDEEIANFKIVEAENGELFIGFNDLMQFFIRQMPHHEIFSQIVFFMEKIREDFLAAKGSYEQKESIPDLWKILEKGYKNGSTSS